MLWISFADLWGSYHPWEWIRMTWIYAHFQSPGIVGGRDLFNSNKAKTCEAPIPRLITGLLMGSAYMYWTHMNSPHGSPALTRTHNHIAKKWTMPTVLQLLCLNQVNNTLCWTDFPTVIHPEKDDFMLTFIFSKQRRWKEGKKANLVSW